MRERAAKRERVTLARQLVEESTMPEKLRENALIILRAPTARQVNVLISLAKRYPPEENK